MAEELRGADFPGDDDTPELEENGDFAPYLGPKFNLYRDLKVEGCGVERLESWVPCERLFGVPLVKGNSMMDPNLGLDLLTSVCVQGDSAPLSTEGSTLYNLVRRELTFFTQVRLAFFS